MNYTEATQDETLAKQDVKKAYLSLIKSKKYDDALLIQLLYSLSLDPDTLWMLKHGNVDEEGILSYRDYKTSKIKRIRLDNKTISFSLFLIELKGKDHTYFKVTKR